MFLKAKMTGSDVNMGCNVIQKQTALFKQHCGEEETVLTFRSSLYHLYHPSGAEPIPAAMGQEAVFTLDMSPFTPVNHWGNSRALITLGVIVIQLMSLVSWPLISRSCSYLWADDVMSDVGLAEDHACCRFYTGSKISSVVIHKRHFLSTTTSLPVCVFRASDKRHHHASSR